MWQQKINNSYSVIAFYFSEKESCSFFETSTLKFTNVEAAFMDIITGTIKEMMYILFVPPYIYEYIHIYILVYMS